MPGGGPSPAETTLPLALKRPAPARPARPHRSPSPGAPGSPADRPAGAGCQDDRLPAARAALPTPRTAPAIPQGRRGAQAPLAPPGGPAGPAVPARPARAPARPGPPGADPPAPAWCDPAPAWRSAPWSRGPPASCALWSWCTQGTLALGNAYNNANTLPNTRSDYLMLGGIFTSVVVPLLVRAAERDPDRGEAYAQRLFTLGALACWPSPWWRRWWRRHWWT